MMTPSVRALKHGSARLFLSCNPPDIRRLHVALRYVCPLLCTAKPCLRRRTMQARTVFGASAMLHYLIVDGTISLITTICIA